MSQVGGVVPARSQQCHLRFSVPFAPAFHSQQDIFWQGVGGPLTFSACLYTHAFWFSAHRSTVTPSHRDFSGSDTNFLSITLSYLTTSRTNHRPPFSGAGIPERDSICLYVWNTNKETYLLAIPNENISETERSDHTRHLPAIIRRRLRLSHMLLLLLQDFVVRFGHVVGGRNKDYRMYYLE
jgi:hypothetical protein